MGRTKIEVNISALGQRNKVMNIIVGSNTTCHDVVRKVLEKVHLRESSSKFQLLAVLKNDSSGQGQVLKDSECLSRIILDGQSNGPIRFILHPISSTPIPVPAHKPASALIRVYYQLNKDIQTFQSLIVSPSMTAKELLELAVPKAAPTEAPNDYCLVLVTPKGDINLQAEEKPHAMRNSSSHFELRKKKNTFSQSNAALPTPSSPDITTADISKSQMLKGKLRLHGELIDALYELASQPGVKVLHTSSVKTRETVLEQALLEQNQILDIMQDLISTLESENKYCREKIMTQERDLQDMSAVDTKNRKEKAELIELRKKLRSSHLVDSHVADLKKKVEDKNKTILSLQSSQKGMNERLEPSQLSSVRIKLEMERVRCISLEEEISMKNDEIIQMKKAVAGWDSTMISKESEILYLRHELENMRKFEQQQQDLIMKQKDSLAEKDLQLTSLTRAHKKEKKVADQLRRVHLHGSSSSLVPKDSDALDMMQTSLFEQISGRRTCTVELTRISEETELGFSIIKVDLPVSRQLPCLIVKAVREDGLAQGLLKPGDEVLEVNGQLCRSIRQSRALRLLEHGMGLLKIVVAREDFELSAVSRIDHHSTPMKSTEITEKMSGEDTLWATAISPTFESFVESFLPQKGNTECITIPESYAISVTREPEGSLSSDHGPDYNSASSEAINIEQHPGISSSVNGLLSPASSREETSSLTKFHSELQDQLDESEHIRLNLESELNVSREEISRLQEECELLRAGNHEFRQRLVSNQTEVTDIKKYISELQGVLVKLESQVIDEQEKLASVENHNKLITSELKEAQDTVSRVREVRENLKQEIKQLKAALEQKEVKVREMEEELQRIKPDNDRLLSSAIRMENEMEKLRSSFEKSRMNLEGVIASLNEEHKLLQSQLEEAQEMSEKNSLSSQEDYRHLTSQLKSAKSLLADAEMKDTQSQLEMRYLKQAADLANQQLEKLEAEHQRTKEELGHFRQEEEASTITLETITINLKGTEMKLEAKQEMVVRLQEEVDNLRRINSKFRNENSQLKEKVRKLDSQLRGSTIEVGRLEQKLELSMREKDETFQQLEKAYEDSSELSMNVERLSALVKELEDENQQVDFDAQEVKVMQDDVVKSFKVSEAKLQQELEVSQRKLETLNQQFFEKKDEMKRIRNSWETSIKELQEAKTENENLSSSREEINHHLTELQENNLKLTLEMGKKVEELFDMKSNSTRYEEEAKIMKQHSDKYKAKILEMESDFIKMASEKEQCENMLASLEFIQKQQQGEIEELQLSTESKEREMHTLQDQIDDMNIIMQKSKVEQTKLTTSSASMRQKLKEDKVHHSEEISGLRDQLDVKEKKLAHLSDDLQAQKTMAEMLQMKVQHLSESVEEKQLLERDMEINLEEKSKLQTQNKELQGQEARLKVKLDQLNASNNLLSSESAGLRQQLRQNERSLDQVKAELHAMEINFEVKTRALEEREQFNSAQSKKLENLEASYNDAVSKLEKVNLSHEASTMDLFKRDEELSNLRASLEMRQTQCDQLQYSLVALQNSIDNYKRRAQELVEEKEEFVSTITKLQVDKEELGKSIEELECTREKEMDEHALKIGEHQKDVEMFQLGEKKHISEIARLNNAQDEANKSITLLLSAQEEMKKSLSKLGDEKDVEIYKLSEKVKNGALELEATKENLYKSERNMKGGIKELEENNASLQRRLTEEESNSYGLKEEIKILKASESEMAELNERVTALDTDLLEKTRQLSELDSLRCSTESQLKEMKIENDALCEKALEAANLKLTMSDHAESIHELRKQLADKETSYKNLLEERNRFLSRVREYEVQQHATVSASEEVMTPAAVDTGIEDLQQVLRKKDEEVVRTREYAEDLLIKVMMNAPHLLEK